MKHLSLKLVALALAVTTIGAVGSYHANAPKPAAEHVKLATPSPVAAVVKTTPTPTPTPSPKASPAVRPVITPTPSPSSLQYPNKP
jgi:hypothetical protein